MGLLHRNEPVRARTALGLGCVKPLGRAEHVERRSSSAPCPRLRWRTRLKTAAPVEQDSPPCTPFRSFHTPRVKSGHLGHAPRPSAYPPIPAVREEGDTRLALWPGKYPLRRLDKIRVAIGDRDWSALYQQKPAPDEGVYFKREWFNWYDQPPEHLTKYGASDYAVKGKSGDWTVHVVAGVDPEDNLYILDLWRKQTTLDVWVEAFFDMVDQHKPMGWAEEDGQIIKSLGPFGRAPVSWRGDGLGSGYMRTTKMPKKRVEAVAYLRTSSATNVGPDKDSDKRQRDAIQAFAKCAGYVIVDEFYDAGVKGADPIEARWRSLTRP
jgi:Resolvase, N terminal domain